MHIIKTMTMVANVLRIHVPCTLTDRQALIPDKNKAYLFQNDKIAASANLAILYLFTMPNKNHCKVIAMAISLYLLYRICVKIMDTD